MPPNVPAAPRIHWFVGILLGRCPRCRRGAVYQGIIKMHNACAYCGFRFDREEGYYTGAMYASYFLAVGALAVIGVLVWLLLGNILSANQGMLLAALVFLPTVPFLFRYSRIIWLYIDVLVDPSQLKE